MPAYGGASGRCSNIGEWASHYGGLQPLSAGAWRAPRTAGFTRACRSAASAGISCRSRRRSPIGRAEVGADTSAKGDGGGGWSDAAGVECVLGWRSNHGDAAGTSSASTICPSGPDDGVMIRDAVRTDAQRNCCARGACHGHASEPDCVIIFAWIQRTRRRGSRAVCGRLRTVAVEGGRRPGFMHTRRNPRASKPGALGPSIRIWQRERAGPSAPHSGWNYTRAGKRSFAYGALCSATASCARRLTRIARVRPGVPCRMGAARRARSRCAC